MRICFECNSRPVGNEIICSKCGGSFEEVETFVGDRRKESRLRMGFSLRSIAKRVGVSAQTMSRVYQCGFSMVEPKIVLLAQALALDHDQLLLDFGRCPSDAVPRTIEEVEAVRAVRMKGKDLPISSW